MSNIARYGGYNQVGRAAERRSREVVVDILSRSDIATTRATEARLVFNTVVSAGVEGYATCAQAEIEVPGSSSVTAPLLRAYRAGLTDILIRGIQ